LQNDIDLWIFGDKYHLSDPMISEIGDMICLIYDAKKSAGKLITSYNYANYSVYGDKYIGLFTDKLRLLWGMPCRDEEL
jgi:hypothetical protein